LGSLEDEVSLALDHQTKLKVDTVLWQSLSKNTVSFCSRCFWNWCACQSL